MSVACAAPPAVTADAVLAEALERLESALDQLGGIDPGDLTGHGLGDSVLALLTARRRVDATTAVVVDRFAHGHEWSADGARSPESWIHGRVNDGFGIARRPREQARSTALFPVMAQAWRDGDIGAGHIDVVSELLGRYPALHDDLVAVDAALTALAREWEPRRFRTHMRALCHRINAEAVNDAERRDRTTTRLHASVTLDGFVRVDGLLDPVVGNRLLAALEAARRILVDDEAGVEGARSGAGLGGEGAENGRGAGAAGGDASGGGASGGGASGGGASGGGASGGGASGGGRGADGYDAGMRDGRHISQRNVDALARILDAASAAEGEHALPSVCGERPVINVLVPIEALLEQSAREIGWLERYGAPATMLTGSEVRQLACDASLRPLLVDRAGRLIAMLPKVRAIHPALRRAVIMRDQHCRFPRCRQRIDEVHHVVFHSHGGPTVMSNLIGLCWFHHHHIHDTGWVLEGDPGGRMRVISPTGREMTSDPPGPVRWESRSDADPPF